jgi:hypothetical protein
MASGFVWVIGFLFFAVAAFVASVFFFFLQVVEKSKQTLCLCSLQSPWAAPKASKHIKMVVVEQKEKKGRRKKAAAGFKEKHVRKKKETKTNGASFCCGSTGKKKKKQKVEKTKSSGLWASTMKKMDHAIPLLSQPAQRLQTGRPLHQAAQLKRVGQHGAHVGGGGQGFE